jgi:hypothetical protein
VKLPRFTAGTVLHNQYVRAGGDFNRMVDSAARRRAALPVGQLVADLRDIVGSRRLAPGQKLADALMDVLVHGQDITVPLGLAHPMPPEAARTSAVPLLAGRTATLSRLSGAGTAQLATTSRDHR